MRRRGIVLAAFGVLMLVAGAAMRFVVVPRAQVLPADTDQTVTFTGTIQTLDLAALLRGERTDTNMARMVVTVKRTLHVAQTEGNKARVSDSTTMTSPANPAGVTVPSSLARTEYLYTIDRKTLEAIANFTDEPAEHAKGLVVGFPIGTAKRDYTGWIPEVKDTSTVSYWREAAVRGLRTYGFTGRYSKQLEAPPLAGAPSAIPKAQLTTVADAVNLPSAVEAQLAQVLPSLPDPVPLAYTFTLHDQYFVEPTTGIIVDMGRSMSITAGIAGLSAVQLPAVYLNIQYSPQSVADMVDKAKGDRNQVQLYGTWLPLGLGVVGLLGLALSVPMLRRRPGDTSFEHREQDRVTPDAG